jgi:hypothetical protein
MKNILAENMLRFGSKNLTESEKINLQRLVETDPGDPSQAAVDLSTEYGTLRSALATYNSTFKGITGVDPGLFLRSSNAKPSQLLITSAKRQDDSGQSAGDNFVLRYDIPTAVLKRRVGTQPPSFYTLQLDGNSIGTSKGGGIWHYAVPENIKSKEKKVEQIKAAANTAGAAIAEFFKAVQTKVPKNYVVTRNTPGGDFIFGPATT